jgi:FkbM family methyltransferase
MVEKVIAEQHHPARLYPIMKSAELVKSLYLALLGRAVEPSALAFWTELIRSTGDPSLVFRGIIESEEYTKHIKADGDLLRPHENIQELTPPPLSRSVAERIEMTTSCRDTDSIPKVAEAGEIFMGPDNTACQRMHNGVIVTAGGYYGEWMSEIIQKLKGHHEPQEELLFHTAAPWMAPHNGEPVMIEMGAFWSYYSLWFRTLYPNARNIMVEPDPESLRTGQKNFALNGFAGEFVEAAVGMHNESSPFLCASDGITRSVRMVSVDGLAKDLRLERIHLLHADIQGAEPRLLTGILETIQEGRLDWLFLSTHHHSISGDPLTHQRCLAWLKNHGANIIEEHSVAESFSGDGLIAARFDGGPPIQFPRISRNLSERALFREIEYDLAEAEDQIRRLQASLGNTEN